MRRGTARGALKGTSKAGSRAILLVGDDDHRFNHDSFEDFYIDGYAFALDEARARTKGLAFHQFRFGTRMPTRFEAAGRGVGTDERELRDVQGMADQ